MTVREHKTFDIGKLLAEFGIAWLDDGDSEPRLNAKIASRLRVIEGERQKVERPSDSEGPEAA